MNALLKEEQQRRVEEEKRIIEAEQKFSQLQNQLLKGHSSEKVASNTQKSDNRSCEFSSMAVRGTSGSKSESGSKRVMKIIVQFYIMSYFRVFFCDESNIFFLLCIIKN